MEFALLLGIFFMIVLFGMIFARLGDDIIVRLKRLEGEHEGVEGETCQHT